MARPPNEVKMTWEEVKHIITQGDLHLLGRSKDQQEVYDTFYNQTKSEWISIADFLLFSKFNYPIIIDEVTGKKSVKRDGSMISEEEKTRLAPNDFPYYFEEGIEHYIYWKLGSNEMNILTETEVEEAAIQLKSKNPSFIDHAIYINPPHLKSIPEIEHAHILFYASPTGAS